MTDLNESQQIAVAAGSGVFQVLAGPGSGKTRVIAARHERLVQQFGKRVLTLTLTRAAADEMRKRTSCGSRSTFRTFHSLAYEIVYGGSGCRRGLDFDLLLAKASLRLAEKNHDYTYDFVQVDEAQDCSGEEWLLLEKLSPNLFCVGDGLQAIYGFRGAHADLFLGMKDRFPSVKILFLGTNYRSTKAIVEFCKSIAPIRGEFLERMCSVQDEGQPVEFLRFNTNVAEAEAIRHSPFCTFVPKDTAILARTKHQLNIFEKLYIHPGVTLNTIHAAKGKEWDNVFVIGYQKGLLPHRDGDRDEEGRILFVACSRAKARLFLTCYGGE